MAFRSSACGCLGAFVKWLPDDEVEMLIGEHLLVDDAANLDWTLRHGRSTGLFVALKSAPGNLKIERSKNIRSLKETCSVKVTYY